MRNDDITAEIKVFLSSNINLEHESGLGLGVVELCERVQRTGSLNKAAAEMGLAYSKAWKIIKNAEDGLGITLFVRQGGHGSQLTSEARSLIKLYREVQHDTADYANTLLQERLDLMIRKGQFHQSDYDGLANKATPELIAQVKALAFS